MKSNAQCCYCGSTNITPFCRRDDAPLHGAYDLCLDCGVYFANPMADDLELAAYYTNYYHGDHPRQSAQNRLASYEAFRKGLLKRIRVLAPRGRYLEIGCGFGQCLAAARDAGYETVGVDLAPNAVQFARDAYGLDARSARLEDLDEPSGSFDVIYSWHTIEHVTDLRVYLSCVADLLRPGGWFVVGTENPEATFHCVYAWLHRRSGLRIPLNSSSSEHTFLLSPNFIRTNFPTFGLRVSRLRAYENWSWVTSRAHSSSVARRVLKLAAWGAVSGFGHITNAGSLLIAEARKTSSLQSASSVTTR